MKVSIELTNDIVSQIQQKVSDSLQTAVDEIIEQNLDEIVAKAISSQVKSITMIYLQSPEFKNKIYQKVIPIVNSQLK